MMKNVLFAVTLLSVALWSGCATGGGGHTGDKITVTVNTNPKDQANVAVTLTVQYVATVTGTSDTVVTWSLTQSGGGTCTGTPNPCGTIDANGLYTAPATAVVVEVTATSHANPTKSDTKQLNVLGITVTVTPKLNDNSLNVGKGVTQQFTATGVPDDARVQSFTWSLVCDAGPGLCGTLTPDPNVSSAARFAAINSIPSPAVAHITATSTIDTTVSNTVDVTIVKSRLSANSTYAFHISGFDASGPIAVAGNFATDANGAITNGREDDLTSTQYSNPLINSGSLAMDTGTNDHGLLTLNTAAGTRKYKVVFNTAGDGRMIEFGDGTGRRGSGEIALAKAKFNDAVLPLGSTFTFGMTGVDPAHKRSGIVGLFQPDGAGTITSGMMDINDFPTAISTSNVTGVYAIAANGRGTMSLTNLDSGKAYNFAFYVVSGQASKAVNPLTLFAISTDDPNFDLAVAGAVVTQDSNQIYDNSALPGNGFSVSNLTGLDSTGLKAQVSLTNARGNGTGAIAGVYSANNAGTIVSAKAFSYTYAFTPGARGRYTVDLLGDPAANPVVPPVHFVLFLSAANRGFLLDQLSSAVYTGTMDQQPVSSPSPTELAGSFEAATGSSGTTAVSQTATNFLFTSLVPTFTLSGTRDETDGGQNAGQVLAGTYTVSFQDGSGTVKITPTGLTPENYVMYVLDNPKPSGSMIQHFVMINVDPANANPAVIFGER